MFSQRNYKSLHQDGHPNTVAPEFQVGNYYALYYWYALCPYFDMMENNEKKNN